MTRHESSHAIAHGWTLGPEHPDYVQPEPRPTVTNARPCARCGRSFQVGYLMPTARFCSLRCADAAGEGA